MKKIALMGVMTIYFLGAFFAVLPGVASAQVDTPPKVTETNPAISFNLPNPLGPNTTTIKGFLANVLDAIVLLLTPVVTIMLLYAGFLFVTAQGKEENLTKAKSALLYTLIGAAIILGAKALADVLAATVTCLAGSTNC